MAIKGKPAPKIQTTGTNTNKKKADPSSGAKFDTAFFKKNEFAMILIGALALTVIVFLIFFRSSNTGSKPTIAGNNSASPSFDMLEKRIKALETGALENKNAPDGSGHNDAKALIAPLDARITRLETVFQVKFDSLIERMDNLEKKLDAAKAQVNTPKPPSVKAPAPKAPVPVKKPANKVAKKDKTAPMLHTVVKGETLYSISKKYNTTVSALRKLNKLTEKDKIYPGNNIMVR